MDSATSAIPAVHLLVRGSVDLTDRAGAVSIDRQVARALRRGFAGVAIPEHHVLREGFAPPPIPLLAWLLGRHGPFVASTHIAIASLYHPLRLAEDIALLQWLSDDSVRLGVGGGFRPAEFQAFGVARDDRFTNAREVTAAVRRLLRGEVIDVEIGPWSGHGLSLQAPPVPPVVLWAAQTPTGVRNAAKAADGVLPNLAPMASQLAVLDEYDKLAGATAQVRTVYLDVIASATLDKARETGARRLAREWVTFRHLRTVYPALDAYARDPVTGFDGVRDMALIGTAEDVRATLAGLGASGVTDVIARVEFMGSTQAEINRTIDTVGESTRPG